MSPKVQVRPWLCCRPLFGKLLLLFVVFFLAAHWGLLLELDVTVAILAQGADPALALLLASFRQIASAFCCLLPCSALGLPLAGARCHRSHFGSRYRSGLGFAASFRQIAAAFCCLLPCSALGLPLAGARCHRSHFGQGTDQALALLPASFRQIAAAFCCLLPCSALGLLLAGARCHCSHFGSRYRSGLGFAAGLFSANCCVVFFLAAQ